ncbi:MAG: hypothetical protein WCO56_09210 [Verrucomicrobiota bacterium]
MIIPQFWAEGRAQHRTRGRQVTIRRFGWSEVSEAEAQANADLRAQEALERVLKGDKLLRREPKVPYNGAEGVPIREEIVSHHGETIVTRNAYGARCLNTPNVLFADIDLAMDSPLWIKFLPILISLALLVIALWQHPAWRALWAVVVSLCIGWFVGRLVAAGIHRLWVGGRDGMEKLARKKMDAFIAQNPDWHLRLYRTPAGFRVLVMHRTFEPGEAAVAEFFAALGTDPVYVRMCLNQQCFRARVSPKPWRAGITGHIRPQSGAWPVAPETLPARNEWIQKYEAAAQHYAACNFIGTLGSHKVDPAAQAVQSLHDELCRATEALMLA